MAKEAKEVAEEVPKLDTPDPYAWILKGIDLGYGPPSSYKVEVAVSKNGEG